MQAKLTIEIFRVIIHMAPPSLVLMGSQLLHMYQAPKTLVPPRVFLSLGWKLIGGKDHLSAH